MKNLRTIFYLLGLIILTGCADLLNSPYPNSGPYGNSYNGYYGSNYNDDYYYRREADRANHERRDLQRERDRLEEERERLERERRREEAQSRPPPREDHCPSGFSPSEQKCSPDERRRGCRDVRLPSGLGCVSR